MSDLLPLPCQIIVNFNADGLFELILKCRIKGKNITLISNGTVASREQYRLSHKMGVSLFELPLLAAQPDMHDELTGAPGVFDKVVSSIRTLVSAGAQICTVFVMTKHNIDELERTLSFAQSLGVSYFMLARFNIGGRGIGHCNELLPTLDELTNAFTVANEFAATSRIRISANVCLPRCIIEPGNFPRIPISTCSQHVAMRPVTVDYEGNVRMCNHSPRIMGNVHVQPMESILSCDYAQTWQTARPELCAECAVWPTCGGGCRAAAEQCGKTLYDEDPVIGMLKPSLSALKSVCC